LCRSRMEGRAVGILLGCSGGENGEIFPVDIESARLILLQKLAPFRRLPMRAQLTLSTKAFQSAFHINSQRNEPPYQSVSQTPMKLISTPKQNQNSGEITPILDETQCFPQQNQQEKSQVKTHPLNPQKKRKRNEINSKMDDHFDGVSASNWIKQRPKQRLSDFGGISRILEEIKESIEWPLHLHSVYSQLGVSIPRGVLLHGPPGCGKTLLADSIAGEFGVKYIRASAPEIVGSMSGESEKTLRSLFQEARRNAPCILFLDEVDAIASRRESASKEMERRIVAQFGSCMDELNECVYPVLVIAATSRPDSIEPALRRAGRFDRELEIGAPDEAARYEIIRAVTKNMALDSESMDFSKLARKTAGYVGADIASLATMAATRAVKRIAERINDKQSNDDKKCLKNIENLGIDTNPVIENNDMEKGTVGFVTDEELETVVALNSSKKLDLNGVSSVTGEVEEHDDGRFNMVDGVSVRMEDFEYALSKMQPSAMREGFSTVPDVTWDNVGALESVRDELLMAVVEPIRHPEKFAALGLSTPAGVLLYGPPGCGKTLLAKAVARESGANFISVKGPELLNKFVGESERSVRRLFSRARASSPCVVFFDELDALAPRRSSGSNGSGDGGSSGASERVVNQLLTELDGTDVRKHVFVIAATNRPDIIDPAMLRPGRLDKLLFVPLPSVDERASILSKCALKTPLHPDVDLKLIASDKRCEGFSGADLSALVREAAVASLRENTQGTNTQLNVTPDHFEQAFHRVFPSVAPHDAKLYQNLQHSLRRSRAHIQ